MALTGAERQARYKAKHPDRVKASSNKWNTTNRREYDKKWRLENRAKVYSWNAERRARKLQATVAWADKESIERLYIVANFLTTKLNEPHHVDHIIPLVNSRVCGLHCEDNLQVITARENLIKGNYFE
mgnify:CR=1 FL=1